MPFIRHHRPHNSLIWGLWHITEQRDELLDNLLVDEELKASVDKLKSEQKVLEAIASRKLLEELTAIIEVHYEGIYKDSHGKPHLINSMSHVSISHSYPYVAASVNSVDPTGIDLEHFNNKVKRIEHRFLNEKEIFDADHQTEKLIIYWSAKEALYKLYGRKKLIFKDNIEILPFEVSDSGNITGRLFIDDSVVDYELQYLRFDGFVMTYTL